jgi:hypothetical protein
MNNTHSGLIHISKHESNRRKKSYTSVQNRPIERQSQSVIANQLLKISDIKVCKRFRRDLGNIDDLVESIRNNGLIVPVTIARDHVLIAGCSAYATIEVNIQVSD